MPVGDAGVGVAGEGDLTLLGETEPAAQGAGGLGHDRAAGGAPAPADRAPAAVEQEQGGACLAAGRDERPLRPVQLPVGGDEAAVLVAVRVPQHDLLLALPSFELPPRA